MCSLLVFIFWACYSGRSLLSDRGVYITSVILSLACIIGRLLFIELSSFCVNFLADDINGNFFVHFLYFHLYYVEYIGN